MKEIMIVLGVIIFVLSLFIMKMRKELDHIHKQIKVKREHNTRFTITCDLNMKEFKQLCLQFNEMYEQYEQALFDESRKEKEFKEMLSYIAHDVRTPLTSVQGYLQILEEENKENATYYAIIHQRIDDIGRLLEQFFIYSKLINNDYTFEEGLCDVYTICCESLLGFYQQFNQLNIEPVIDFESTETLIKINKDLFRRVMDNLIQNAFIHGNGHIKIIQKGTHLIVENTIKKELNIDSNKVFERFYKVDTSRTHISSGLGLSIVKEIIHLSGGKVEANIIESTFNIVIKGIILK